MNKVDSIKMRTSLLVCLAGLSTLAAHAGFVSETGAELITLADLNGDGRQDIVIVDKATGTFRAGYQTGANTFTWSVSRAVGATNITGLTTGPILNPVIDAIAVTTPNLNRVNVIAATKPTAPIYPVAVFGTQYGPLSPVALEIGGGTAEMDLIVAHILGTPFANRLELIESSGTAFSPLATHTISGVWNRGNNVDFNAGDRGAAFIDRTVNMFRLYEFSSGSIRHLSSLPLNGLSNADYCTIHPVTGGYMHVFAWDRGQSTAYRFALGPGETFGPAVAVDFGTPVEQIHTVNAAGTDWLVVIFSDGSAAVYAYDGTSNPTLDHALAPAPSGFRFSGALPSAPDSFSLLTADQLTGRSGIAELFEYNGDSFVGQGAIALPPVIAGRARGNVMTFRKEPFVNADPQRLQVLNAGDWTDQVNLLTAPPRIRATYEVDQGLPAGLGTPTLSTLGTPHPDAAYTLGNQAGTAFSIFNLGAAFGNQGAEVFIAPDPGHYGTGVSVTFTNATGSPILYRDSTATVWSTYSTPLPLFKDSTLLYFSQDGGERSPIYTAAYTFDDAPGELDSDGDDVPDYVEIANGLDPLESGSDGDGDGFQDLEELIAGTDPANSNDVPTLPILGSSDRLERASNFDLLLTPRPFDGTDDSITLCQTGTALRAFSGGGWQYAYGTTTNHGIGGVTDPSVKLEAIPASLEPRMFVLLTDQHYPINTTFSNKMIGIEMAGVRVPPVIAAPVIAYSYGGGPLAAEAASWVAAAQTAYSTVTVTVVTGELGTDDVLAAMLIERKLADELVARGIYTNRLVSLFAARPADSTLQSMTQSELFSLQSATNTFDAYLPATLIGDVNSALATPGTALLRQLTQELFAVCSRSSDASPGAYPLPIGVLRNFLLSGNLHSNYAAQVTLSGSQLTTAYNQSAELLAAVPSRPVQSFQLEVRADSFGAACPVLYTSADAAKSLYDEGGRPYIMPFSFALGAGAELSATAFTDVLWNRCPGTDPIEIISLSLTTVPVSSDADADGNLLPDAFEQNILGGGGHPAHLDSDGDGYSDLQEYLDGTDPSDILSLPTGAVVDLSPPEVFITSLAADVVQLDIDWPGAYAAPFVFTVTYSDDLATPGFLTHHELDAGSLSTILDASSTDARFYKVGISLR